MKYRAATDAAGKLLGVVMDIYGDLGSSSNEIYRFQGILQWCDNVYFAPNWKINIHACKTNTPANTACRAPASTEGIYFIEHLLEHMSQVLKKPSLELRQLNFYINGDRMMGGATVKDFTLPALTDQLLQSSDYKSRSEAVATFNTANRWRKRGISVVPIRYAAHWNIPTRIFHCLVAIFHGDGTVAVTHGGIEMGQGINTKIAQVVASELGVDMKYIDIQPTQAITTANGGITGGSVTSELVSLAAIDACRQLRTRIDVVRRIDPTKTWPQLIEDCFKKGVDLSARSGINAKTPDHVAYNVYTAMCTEIELDILTGEFIINRLDILYDCGESMSPLIDVGQVEGAVEMGLGYYTSEEQIYDPKTGENLSYGTWKYKPPMAKDIPVDFRVTLLQNAPNPSGVLRSKLVGEPPLCGAASVVFALRNAIAANLNETGKGADWFTLVAPMTVERIQQYNRIEISQLRYKD
ncbi:Xanthine dehydrogenase [Hypsibius exemplaris]|uniref:Xanthine dehydrogenase n=1 Tax=Hypsibius exemplaris TaxID=2072580 RepID=A0A1W0X6R7_HYPEX|nr:Xanthine dehydrogenase [Hypsibius exemplaris]